MRVLWPRGDIGVELSSCKHRKDPLVKGAWPRRGSELDNRDVQLSNDMLTKDKIERYLDGRLNNNNNEDDRQ